MQCAPEGFYFQATNGSVALPVAGYDCNSVWTPLLAGLSPAGMAASLAAPDPYGPNSGIRLPPWGCDGKAFFFVTACPNENPARPVHSRRGLGEDTLGERHAGHPPRPREGAPGCMLAHPD